VGDHKRSELPGVRNGYPPDRRHAVSNSLADADPDANSVADAHTHAHAAPFADSNPRADADPKAKPDTGAESDARTDSDRGNLSNAIPDADANTHAGAHADSETESDPEAKPDSGDNSGPVGYTFTDAHSGAHADAKAESDPEAKPDPIAHSHVGSWGLHRPVRKWPTRTATSSWSKSSGCGERRASVRPSYEISKHPRLPPGGHPQGVQLKSLEVKAKTGNGVQERPFARNQVYGPGRLELSAPSVREVDGAEQGGGDTAAPRTTQTGGVMSQASGRL